MIQKVSFRNFKSLRDVQIELERLTIFVGPNASGKSSILQGLNLLCQIFQPQPVPPMQPAASAEAEIARGVTRGVTEPPDISVEKGGKWYRYFRNQTSTPKNKNPRRPGHPPQSLPPNDGREMTPGPQPSGWTPWNYQTSTSLPLPRSVLLRLEASKLIPANANNPDPTVMAPDGTGLHSALASMALNDPDSWQRLQADLRRIIPSIRRLRHTKTATQNQVVSLLFDTLGADDLPATQVSEGTLLVLGLLAALHAPTRPNLILLDDLDRGLHPKAQKELVMLLRVLLDANHALQVLATTHSPYLLDSLEANEVRMTYLQDDGATLCAPLVKHPEFGKWKDEMTPGEMWSLFGERWLEDKAEKRGVE